MTSYLSSLWLSLVRHQLHQWGSDEVPNLHWASFLSWTHQRSGWSPPLSHHSLPLYLCWFQATTMRPLNSWCCLHTTLCFLVYLGCFNTTLILIGSRYQFPAGPPSATPTIWSQAITPGTSPLTTPEPLDLTNVPIVYHSVINLFSKTQALSLPPQKTIWLRYHTWSCIALQSYLQVVSSCKKSMEASIWDSLAVGFIFIAWSFFVKKKDKSVRPCIAYRGLSDIRIMLKNYAVTN